MSIEVCNVSKAFGNFKALNDVSLSISPGELVALLGPSGCGKTTLLRIIAGLEMQDSGSVYFYGEDTSRKHARERRVGFVFQHYALFQHMSVFENVAFGLRVRPRRLRPSKKEIHDKVMDLLKMVHLDAQAHRFPSQLSGGQRQRVALARSLAIEPKVLLLDEPFGALDANVRKELRRRLRQLHDELHVTTVFVTHDQEEALEVADRLVVMDRGVVQQVGSPEEVYRKPANAFVYRFLGNVNVFQGKTGDGQDALLCFRPHALDLHYQPNGRDLFHARVKRVKPAGALVKIELVNDTGELVEVDLTQERYSQLNLVRDHQVYVSARESAGHYIDYSI